MQMMTHLGSPGRAYREHDFCSLRTASVGFQSVSASEAKR
jgi:hypothetical protein